MNFPHNARLIPDVTACGVYTHASRYLPKYWNTLCCAADIKFDFHKAHALPFVFDRYDTINKSHAHLHLLCATFKYLLLPRTMRDKKFLAVFFCTRILSIAFYVSHYCCVLLNVQSFLPGNKITLYNEINEKKKETELCNEPNYGFTEKTELQKCFK